MCCRSPPYKHTIQIGVVRAQGDHWFPGYVVLAPHRSGGYRGMATSGSAGEPSALWTPHRAHASRPITNHDEEGMYILRVRKIPINARCRKRRSATSPFYSHAAVSRLR